MLDEAIFCWFSEIQMESAYQELQNQLFRRNQAMAGIPIIKDQDIIAFFATIYVAIKR
jgi:hypothetical protein